MSKRIKTIFKCDICGKECDKEKDIFSIAYPVIFITEQQEGKSCMPYIDVTRLDLCSKCANKVSKIEAQGAMGYNKYRIMGGKQ